MRLLCLSKEIYGVVVSARTTVNLALDSLIEVKKTKSINSNHFEGSWEESQWWFEILAEITYRDKALAEDFVFRLGLY